MWFLRAIAPTALPPLIMSDSRSLSDRHLATEDVAAYLGSQMPDSDRRRIAAHLADCDRCRAEVLDVRSILRTAPRGRHYGRPIIGVLGVAAAAVLLITVQWRTAPRSDRDDDSPPVTERTQLSDAGRDSVEVVAPGSDAVVARRALALTWRRGAEDAQFTVTLMNARGDLQWSIRTRDSTVTVPDSISLTPGTAYIVYVDALRADGTSARSGPRSFTVGR